MLFRSLHLLQTAAKHKQRACYVCYNKPLADHLAKLAPAAVEVTTFHQLCRDWAERQGQEIDFSDTKVFDRITQQYVDACEQFTQNLDLLIIDESQDFEQEWAHAVNQKLKNSGKLYVMGDGGQQLYSRDAFDLEDAVQIRCMDNFRSPRKVVNKIGRAHV